MGQLDDQGYHVIFRYREWKIVKESFIIAHSWKKGTLYMIELPSDKANAVISRSDPSTLSQQ